MKKLLAVLVSLAVFSLIGAGFAQVGTQGRGGGGWGGGNDDPPPVVGDYSDNSQGGNEASLTEAVSIVIPDRVALHLTDTGFTLNLNELDPDEFDVHPELGCYLVRKENIGKFASYDAFIEAISFDHDVVNYPAVVFDDAGNVASDGDGYLKGGLACMNTKIIQKFSNYAGGWELLADVEISGGSGIKFGIMDVADNMRVDDGNTETCIKWHYPKRGGPKCAINIHAKRYYVDKTSSKDLKLDGSSLAQHEGKKTNGWLDDEITEWFYFDGSETAGNHKVTIKFTLTGSL